jgi:hypothetical protein
MTHVSFVRCDRCSATTERRSDGWLSVNWPSVPWEKFRDRYGALPTYRDAPAPLDFCAWECLRAYAAAKMADRLVAEGTPGDCRQCGRRERGLYLGREGEPFRRWRDALISDASSDACAAARHEFMIHLYSWACIAGYAAIEILDWQPESV